MRKVHNNISKILTWKTFMYRNSKKIHSYLLPITNFINISFGNEMDIKLNQQ